jgi:hypothetical protein
MPPSAWTPPVGEKLRGRLLAPAQLGGQLAPVVTRDRPGPQGIAAAAIVNQPTGRDGIQFCSECLQGRAQPGRILLVASPALDTVAGGGDVPTCPQAKQLACGVLRTTLGQLHELDRCEPAEQGRIEASQLLKVRVIPAGREELGNVLGAEAIVTYRHHVAVLPPSGRDLGCDRRPQPDRAVGSAPRRCSTQEIRLATTCAIKGSRCARAAGRSSSVRIRSASASRLPQAAAASGGRS